MTSRSIAHPDITSSLLLRLPDELFEEIVKHLLPSDRFRDKPIEAVRLGSTCQHLHELVRPLAFETLVIRERKRTNAWLADYLLKHGHLVRRLSVHMLRHYETNAALISMCVKRCPNRIDVKLDYFDLPDYNPLFAVFSATVRPELEALDIGVAAANEETVQLAVPLLRSCGQLHKLVSTFTGTLVRLHVEFGTRWLFGEMPPGVPETVTPAVLPNCTDIHLSGKWAKQVLTQVIHPKTPLRRVHYSTVVGVAFDDEMPQVIQSFHAKQPVKTFEVIRLEYDQQLSSAIRIAERDKRAEQLRRFEDWGRAVGVKIDVEDEVLTPS
ncbi:hypothetical protein JCM10908_006860 [Rhodotorula pacifica]|uniref:F-box protein n=1 Tax=Rhodotorula pacifica TaxID=1495444 RepID=UPI0031760406